MKKAVGQQLNQIVSHELFFSLLHFHSENVNAHTHTLTAHFRTHTQLFELLNKQSKHSQQQQQQQRTKCLPASIVLVYAQVKKREKGKKVTHTNEQQQQGEINSKRRSVQMISADKRDDDSTTICAGSVRFNAQFTPIAHAHKPHANSKPLLVTHTQATFSHSLTLLVVNSLWARAQILTWINELLLVLLVLASWQRMSRLGAS